MWCVPGKVIEILSLLSKECDPTIKSAQQLAAGLHRSLAIDYSLGSC